MPDPCSHADADVVLEQKATLKIPDDLQGVPGSLCSTSGTRLVNLSFLLEHAKTCTQELAS